MKIDILKQRRKTISLKILDGEKASLKVPFSMPDKKIQEFLSSKHKWLIKNMQKLKYVEEFSKSFNFAEKIYVDGIELMFVDQCCIDFSNLSSEKKKNMVIRFYQDMFKNLEMLAYEKSKKVGLPVNEIKLLNSVRIWGSFNEKKTMKLNWRLIILPERLIDYVICHELCHGLHMNHKPQFWRSVAKICPDYRKLKTELSQYSFVLKDNFSFN